jgi:hypothetical protein
VTATIELDDAAVKADGSAFIAWFKRRFELRLNS